MDITQFAKMFPQKMAEVRTATIVPDHHSHACWFTVHRIF